MAADQQGGPNRTAALSGEEIIASLSRLGEADVSAHRVDELLALIGAPWLPDAGAVSRADAVTTVVDNARQQLALNASPLAEQSLAAQVRSLMSQGLDDLQIDSVMSRAALLTSAGYGGKDLSETVDQLREMVIAHRPARELDAIVDQMLHEARAEGAEAREFESHGDHFSRDDADSLERCNPAVRETFGRNDGGEWIGLM